MRLPNIFLIGPMGAGKSTIGRAIAKKLQREFYDTDQEIEARAGADLAWIFDLEGEDGYRKREKQVIEELTKNTNIVLATGGGAITQSENRNALAARGIVIYLKTSLEQQFARTRRDSKRPLLQTKDVHNRIKELWAQREPFYIELADYSFDTDEKSISKIANVIVDYLHDKQSGLSDDEN